jgi:hypothetical protein
MPKKIILEVGTHIFWWIIIHKLSTVAIILRLSLKPFWLWIGPKYFWISSIVMFLGILVLLRHNPSKESPYRSVNSLQLMGTPSSSFGTVSYNGVN